MQHLAYSIGRTAAWVRDRLYLDRLAPSVQERVLQGTLYLIFAREIAKLADPDEQERVASLCQADPKDGHCSATIHQVRRYVSDRQNSLRGVPWQLDKPFPQHKLIVGACSNCPFNSSNDQKLFEHDEAAAPEGYCLRTSCFEAKQQLAEKATAKAVAKILKQELAPTEMTAAEVTPEYVKPARVARQAKKQLDGSTPKAEKKTLAYHETPEYKARMALGDAERKWQAEVDEKLTDSLKENPGRLTALMLIAEMGQLHWNATEKQIEKLQQLLKGTVTVKTEFLAQLEKSVLRRKEFQFGSIIGIHGKENLVKALADLYGIELSEAPRLEDFVAADGEAASNTLTPSS